MLTDDSSEMGARIGFGFAFHGLGSLIGAFVKLPGSAGLLLRMRQGLQ